MTDSRDLFEAALAAREKSYAPYSKCRIGAAVRTKTGEIFSGCNVENASYGATTCAERVAIQKAVSEGHQEIREVIVVSSAKWPPCGMCCQVISEFAPQDAVIRIANLEGDVESTNMRELMWRPFGKDEYHRDVATKKEST